MAEENEELDEEIETPKPSKLPLILAALAAFILGGGAGFGGSMLMGGDDAEAAEESAEGEGEEEGPSAEELAASRVVLPVGAFTMNLRGSGGGRVLRMEIQVETSTEDQPLIEQSIPMLRDAVITVVSDYSYADVEGLDGKTRLRDELLGRMNALLPGDERIQRVYLTEFVVQ